ncbi:MAG: hypothetical protein ACI90V_002335 [Bacillariaceae sp.]|jgi:hypothetical protein
MEVADYWWVMFYFFYSFDVIVDNFVDRIDSLFLLNELYYNAIY